MNEQWILFLLLAALVLAAVLVALFKSGWLRKRIPYDTPDFRDRAGFQVIQLPHRNMIQPGNIWLLHHSVGELQFNADPEWAGILRVVKAGGDLLLEDFGSSYDIRSTFDQDGIQVVLLQSPNGPCLTTWRRNGFDYALYFETCEMGLASALTYDFVKDTDSSFV